MVYSNEWATKYARCLTRWTPMYVSGGSRCCATTPRRRAAPKRQLDRRDTAVARRARQRDFCQVSHHLAGAFRKSGNKPPEHDRETYDLVSNGCLLVEETAIRCGALPGPRGNRRRQPRRRPG